MMSMSEVDVILGAGSSVLLMVIHDCPNSSSGLFGGFAGGSVGLNGMYPYPVAVGSEGSILASLSDNTQKRSLDNFS